MTVLRPLCGPPVPPPPPAIPPPGTLTEEEQDRLPPTSTGSLSAAALERIIGERPVDLDLYRTAFTHPDAGMPYNFEKFEFLGDAILGFVAARYLYDRFPDEQEGFLTIMRTRLTRSDQLARFAKDLGLEQFVVMRGKSIYLNYQRSKRVLEDVFEALVAAIYLDNGLLAARTFITKVFDRADWADLHKNRNWKDQLMQHQHKLHQPLPVYQCTRDDDDRTYTVVVELNGHVGIGVDRVKKKAEQLAAKEILVSFGVSVDD